MKQAKKPDDKDTYTCASCGAKNRHRSPYLYSTRQVRDVPIQVIDSWNIPYSTGLYILVQDDVPLPDIEAFANEKAHFPFWPLVYRGRLYSKETWDD